MYDAVFLSDKVNVTHI